MIPKDFITEWREHAPWVADRQVEQDLVISRALVALFSSEAIAAGLAFRGGTALYKLHLRPGMRSPGRHTTRSPPGSLTGWDTDMWTMLPRRHPACHSAASSFR